VDRREEVGGPAQVLDRQLEEQLLVGQPLAGLAADRVVVVTRADRLVEDRRVGGEPGDRVRVDVLRPSSSMLRVMLSSQRLWPRSCRASVAFMVLLPDGVGSGAVSPAGGSDPLAYDVHHTIGCEPELVEELLERR
jgi:hypothetical protein